MDKLKFAIIGCGRIGQRHAVHIQNSGMLAAVCDVIPEKAQEVGKKYNANAYTSIEDLLKAEEHLDVIAICTPNGLHAEHSIKALKAGINVLCEKPMALSVRECGEMIKTAENANKRLFIVKQNRFNPPVEAIKKLLDEEKLGKIYSVQLNCFWNRDAAYYHNSWKGTKKLDGGTLFTQFSHFIDLLYWMIGDVKQAKAFTGNYAHEGMIEFEDTGVISFLLSEHNAPGVMHYTTSAFQKNMEGSITIFAERATIKIGGKYLNAIEYQVTDGFDIGDIPESSPANNYGDYEGSMSNHDKVIDNVVKSLQGKGEIMTNAYDGLKTVEIIENIYQLASHGRN